MPGMINRFSSILMHHQPSSRLLAAAFAMLLASCSSVPLSTPDTGADDVGAVEQAMLQQLVTQQERLYRVAGPLLVSNAQLCGDNARNLLGFTAKNKYSYSEDLSDAAQAMLGLEERLQVVAVLASGGAARAGLLPGDRLLAVEGEPLPTGVNAEREAAALLAPKVRGRSSMSLTVARNDNPVTLKIPLTFACAFSIEIGNTDNVSAYNDGRHIMVTRGMMNFTQSDDELAYVLARELAHNALKHASKLRMNGPFQTLIAYLRRVHPNTDEVRDAYSRLQPYPQDLDGAADRMALYMVARAGYNIDNAQRFWERLASQYPSAKPTGYTALHPSTSYRMMVIARTVAEIKEKKISRKALLP